MRPVAASDNWTWTGYEHAWIELAGRRMQSVPGGTHWGGGVSINSIDQARIGQLLLDEGRANGRQVISSPWIERMRSPCAIAPFYGYLTWLNHARRIFPSVPASSCFAIGAGSSFTWVEPVRRMVLVVRWIDAEYADAFFGRMLRALDASGS
jgi:CubicO group peptidase (beta-lactamase class C family)